jgi:lysophospholipase L1-like esterase
MELTDLAWHDPAAAPFRLTGFPWYDTARVFRRLPVLPAGVLPEAVDGLAWHSAGGTVAFRTDSPCVAVDVELPAPALMEHMPGTGQSGVDVYLGDPGAMRFSGVSRFGMTADRYTVFLVNGLSAEMRTVTLHLPLYNGVKALRVGLAPGAAVAAPPPFAAPGRIVVYGSSITQGGCAARPGIAYPAILARRLNLPFINEGFSGSGRGEASVIDCLAQIPDVAGYVLDFVANCPNVAWYAEALPRAIGQLRAAHPGVPILLLSRIRWGGQRASDDLLRDTAAVNAAHTGPGITALDMSDALGDDYDECTVDTVHPTDLGFHRMADAIEPAVRGMAANLVAQGRETTVQHE